VVENAKKQSMIFNRKKLSNIVVIFSFLLNSCSDDFSNPPKGVVILEVALPRSYDIHEQNEIIHFVQYDVGGLKPTGFPDGKVEYERNEILIKLPRRDDSSIVEIIARARAWLDFRGYESVRISTTSH